MFPEDLLELAQDLTNLYAGNSRQATLRRAVSTADHALFHLLISDATLNWARPELRPALGRLFEHGPMRLASESQISQLRVYFKGRPSDGPERTASEHLRNVANTFVQTQQSRQDADYNTAKEWTLTEVETQIKAVAEALRSWSIIRERAIAQAYLLSLLGSKDRRQNRRERLPNQTGSQE